MQIEIPDDMMQSFMSEVWVPADEPEIEDTMQAPEFRASQGTSQELMAWEFDCPPDLVSASLASAAIPIAAC